MRVIDPASARQMVAELDAGKLARAAWRATVPDENGRGRFALIALDLVSAELVLVAWTEGAAPPPSSSPLLVLVSSDSEAHERTRERLGSGLDVPPSAELVEETVVRDARREAEVWTHVEEQLGRIYAPADAKDGFERARRQEEGAA